MRVLTIAVLTLPLLFMGGCSKDRNGRGWDFGAALFGGETAVAHEQRVAREREEDARKSGAKSGAPQSR